MYLFVSLLYYESTVAAPLFGPALRVHDLRRTTAQVYTSV